MGVKNLSVLNKALLCKWSWRFAIERGAFWNQVIHSKYGEAREGWATQEVKRGIGLGWVVESDKEGLGSCEI